MSPEQKAHQRLGSMTKFACTVFTFIFVGSLAARASVPASGWTARDCHLTSQDYSLLETLRDKLASSQDPFSDKSQIPVDTTPPAFPANDVNYGIPGILEAWHVIAKEKQSLWPLTIDQLLLSAEENPRFKECKLTLSQSLKRDLLRKRKIAFMSASLYDGEISFLQFVGLANVFMNNANGVEVLNPLARAEDLDNDQQELVYYPLKDALAIVIGAISQTADSKMPRRPDIRALSGIVEQDGIRQVATATVIDRFPSILKPASFFISPQQRENFLFDDTIINSVRFPSAAATATGASVLHDNEPASSFEIGKKKHEDTIARQISDCMRGFKPIDDSLLGAQIVSYFNRACHSSENQIMLLVPDRLIQIPKMDWNQISSKTIVPLGHPAYGISFKRFLELTGHSTKYDFAISGRLMIGGRREFMASLKKEGLSVEESESLIEQFSGFSVSQILQPNRQDPDLLKTFVGFAPLLLALSTKDYDEMKITIGFNSSSQKTDVIGLHSLFSPGEPILKTVGASLSLALRFDIQSHVSDSAGCITQTDTLQRTMSAITQSTDMRNVMQAQSMFSTLNRLVLYANRTMALDCQRVALKPIKEQIKNQTGKLRN